MMNFSIALRHANFPTAVFASEFLRMFLAKPSKSIVFLFNTPTSQQTLANCFPPLQLLLRGFSLDFFSFFGGWVFSFPIHTSVRAGVANSVPVNRVDIWHTPPKEAVFECRLTSEAIINENWIFAMKHDLHDLILFLHFGWGSMRVRFWTSLIVRWNWDFFGDRFVFLEHCRTVGSSVATSRLTTTLCVEAAEKLGTKMVWARQGTPWKITSLNPQSWRSQLGEFEVPSVHFRGVSRIPK